MLEPDKNSASHNFSRPLDEAKIVADTLAFLNRNFPSEVIALLDPDNISVQSDGSVKFTLTGLGTLGISLGNKAHTASDFLKDKNLSQETIDLHNNQLTPEPRANPFCMLWGLLLDKVIDLVVENAENGYIDLIKLRELLDGKNSDKIIEDIIFRKLLTEEDSEVQNYLTLSYLLVRDGLSKEEKVDFLSILSLKLNANKKEVAAMLIELSIGETRSLVASRLVVKAISRTSSLESEIRIVKLLSDMVDKVPEQYAINFCNALDSDLIKSALDVEKMLKRIASQFLMRQVAHTFSWNDILEFPNFSGWPMGLWNRRRTTSEAKEILYNFRKIDDSHEGFSSDTFYARRAPVPKAKSLYVKFATDIGKASLLNSNDRDGHPGPGLIIEDINLKNALAAYANYELADPFGTYRAIWPRVSGVIDDLAKTRFVVTRGLIIITPPEKENYLLPNIFKSSAPDSHHSLIIYNSHHKNLECKPALVYPTKEIDSLLANRSVQIFPETLIPDPLLDINDIDLSLSNLQSGAKDQNIYGLEVANAEVAAGHYEFAVPDPAGSLTLPVEPWPPQRELLWESRSIPLEWSRRRDLETSDFHKRVNKFTYNSIQLLRTLYYVRSEWSIGRTESSSIEVNFTNTDLQNALKAKGLPTHYNPNCLRMLQEACLWSSAREDLDSKIKNDPRAFPVFVLADSQKRASVPNISAIALDTFSGLNGQSGMTFTDFEGNKKTVKFSSKGKSLKEALFFIEHVLEKFPRSGIEFRPYDRELLK